MRVFGRIVTAADAQRQPHVLAYGEPRQEVRGLEHDAHLARRAGHRLVVERKPAGVVCVEARQHAQQRALAAARGTDDADEFAFADLEVDLVERVNAAARRGDIGLADLIDTDERSRALRAAIGCCLWGCHGRILLVHGPRCAPWRIGAGTTSFVQAFAAS